MITSDYLRVMSRYNRWQNGEIYGAAKRLDDDARRQDRGAFFGSIHGTLSHIYWADRIWFSRFDLVEAPDVPNRESPRFVEDFGDLVRLRSELDDKIVGFSDAWENGTVSGELTWYSGAIGGEASAPRTMIFIHIFNHQTHHRGQVHAMLTAAGAKTADTDLFLMPQDRWPDLRPRR